MPATTKSLVALALGLFACGTVDNGPPTKGGAAGLAGAASGSAGSGPGGSATGPGGSAGAAGLGGGGASSIGPDASADASGEDSGSAGPRDATSELEASTTPDDASSGSCPTTATELCDGFESGQIDPQKWKIVKPTTSASVTVDDTRPHTGRYALHIKLVPGQSSTAQIADAVTFPAASNTFYTRAFFYFSPDLPADNNGGFHMAYLLATGNNDLGFVEAGLGSAGNKQYLGYSEYYGSGPDNHAHGPTFTEFGPRSQVQVVPMKWICLELLQGGDATTTTRRVWVDGNELVEQRSSFSDRKPPAFSLVSIGVLQYHPTTILSDVWVDDVRVSKGPIGCTP